MDYILEKLGLCRLKKYQELRQNYICVLENAESLKKKVNDMSDRHGSIIINLFRGIVKIIEQMITQNMPDLLIINSLTNYLECRLIFKELSSPESCQFYERDVCLRDLLKILWTSYRDGLPTVYENIISNKFYKNDFYYLVSSYHSYASWKDDPKELFLDKQIDLLKDDKILYNEQPNIFFRIKLAPFKSEKEFLFFELMYETWRGEIIMEDRGTYSVFFADIAEEIISRMGELTIEDKKRIVDILKKQLEKLNKLYTQEQKYTGELADRNSRYGHEIHSCITRIIGKKICQAEDLLRRFQSNKLFK